MTNKQAIEEIKRWTPTLLTMGEKCTNETMIAQQKAIASLENEKPIGYWKIINNKYVECSNCNKRSINQLAYAPMYYCPICGASMHIKYLEGVEND